MNETSMLNLIESYLDLNGIEIKTVEAAVGEETVWFSLN